MHEALRGWAGLVLLPWEAKGPRSVRAETAGLVVAAAILYHYGQLEP